MIRFLDPSEIDERYRGLVRPGSSVGAAVSSAAQRHHYEGVTDLVELAATLLVRINEMHPRIDGNKRASVQLCDEFLGLNDHRLEGEPDKLAAFVWKVAQDRRRADAVEGLRAFVTEGAPARPFDERYPEVIDDLAR
ncbi:MAG: type II toxin-antitoxin system death-on-curing family toxin [Gaiellales bacterium]